MSYEMLNKGVLRTPESQLQLNNFQKAAVLKKKKTKIN